MSEDIPRILIVEDETLIALLLEDFLIEMGAEIAGIAATVTDAVNMVAQLERIDAATVDCQLGSEQSWPVAAALHARGVPILFTTGSPAEPMPAMFEGMAKLGKPFTSTTLRNALAPLIKLRGNPAAGL